MQRFIALDTFLALNGIRAGLKGCDGLFALMTILSQSFFPFVGGHLVSFFLLTAGHNSMN